MQKRRRTIRDDRHHNRRKDVGTRVVPYWFLPWKNTMKKYRSMPSEMGRELPELVVESGGCKKTWGNGAEANKSCDEDERSQTWLAW